MARITKTNTPTPYNVNGAAQAIGCTPGTLYEYLRAGLIVSVRRTRLDDSSIDQCAVLG